jgi:hypothetical protein
MPILPFGRKPTAPRGDVADLLAGFSIEVMPRTAEKVEDFRAILPPGTRVYVAHIDGTPIDDMIRTARRLREDGFPVMPHIPARSLSDRDEFETWLRPLPRRGGRGRGAGARRRRARAAGRVRELHGALRDRALRPPRLHPAPCRRAPGGQPRHRRGRRHPRGGRGRAVEGGFRRTHGGADGAGHAVRLRRGPADRLGRPAGPTPGSGSRSTRASRGPRSSRRF